MAINVYIRVVDGDGNFIILKRTGFDMLDNWAQYAVEWIDDINELEFLEIKEWVSSNCKGKWQFDEYSYYCDCHDTWLYLESDDDLMLSKLRWQS